MSSEKKFAGFKPGGESGEAMKQVNKDLGIETTREVSQIAKEQAREIKAQETKKDIDDAIEVAGDTTTTNPEKEIELDVENDANVEDITDTPEGAVAEMTEMEKARQAIEEASKEEDANIDITVDDSEFRNAA